MAPEKAPAAAGGGPDDKTYFINVARCRRLGRAVPNRGGLRRRGPERRSKSPTCSACRCPRFDEGVKFQAVYASAFGRRKDYRLVGDPEGFVSHIGVGLWDSRANHRSPRQSRRLVPQGQLVVRLPGRRHALFVQQSDRPAGTENRLLAHPHHDRVASLAVLALGVVLLRFSLATKVSAILALALAGLFAGLFSPSLVNSWLLAARLGIAAVRGDLAGGLAAVRPPDAARWPGHAAGKKTGGQP